MWYNKVKTIEEVRDLLAHKKTSRVKVGVVDIDGIIRGKYMSRDKFFSILDKGFGFCDVVLGWDMADQLYDNVKYTGWHTGYPDAQVKIIHDSGRDIPGEENVLFFQGEFDGSASQVCPRNLLKRVLAKAQEMGFIVDAGFEYEFFVFNETSHSVREKNYKNLQPMMPGEFGYSVIRNSVESDCYLSFLDYFEKMGIEIEGLHEETGPGVLEAAIAHRQGVQSADDAVLFKTFSKVFFQKNNKVATFMARWSEQYPGQSGHIHVSLKDKQGHPVFHSKDKVFGVSQLMSNFVAGQQLLMPELLAMVAPTVNSYRRLVPGYWAPTSASVGVENRTCALRIIPGDGASQRVEYRIAAADANPYIIMAAVIGSGLWGIENQAELKDIVNGNAYDQEFDERYQLPQDLWSATQKLKISENARKLFSDEFVDHFCASREWEVRESYKSITEWELNRYFEII